MRFHQHFVAGDYYEDKENSRTKNAKDSNAESAKKSSDAEIAEEAQAIMKNIVMKVIPHSEHRYDTLGDYWIDADGTWQFRVSDMGDWRYNFSVLLHEFVEFALLKHKGVSEPDVLAFDLSVKPDSPYADDPGFDPSAPYHVEHVFADCMERLIAPHLGMLISDPWDAANKLPQWQPKSD